MSMEEVRWKAVFPGIEVTSSILQCQFPPFSAKSVHPSVNLPVANPMIQVIFQTTSKDGNDRMLEQPEEKEIPMEDKSAAQQIDAILKKYDDWRGEMLSRLRALIKQADPALVEEVKWKKLSRPEGVPVWSHDGILCFCDTLKNAVRLTFPKRAQMKDPHKLFNARLHSKTVRAIDFHEGDTINEAALKALMLDAVGLNKSKPN